MLLQISPTIICACQMSDQGTTNLALCVKPQIMVYFRASLLSWASLALVCFCVIVGTRDVDNQLTTSLFARHACVTRVASRSRPYARYVRIHAGAHLIWLIYFIISCLFHCKSLSRTVPGCPTLNVNCFCYAIKLILRISLVAWSCLIIP